MKVALISLARRGGMVHFQAELANALAATTPTIAVCSLSAPASLISPAVHRIAVQTGRTPFESFFRAASPTTWLGLVRSLRSYQPDVVHIVGSHEWNALVAVVIKLLGKPLVYTLHDPAPHPGTSSAMRISSRLAAKMADAIVVLTRSGRDDLVSNGMAPEKVYHIPLGVFSFFGRWRRPSVKPEKVILYFGRMETYKGLDVLLAAFAQIRGRLHGWQLILAGSGALAATLATTAPPSVKVLNRYIPDEEVAGLMQRARLVVVPYTTATQSGAVATAYAFGRPVIGTDVGGLGEMIVHGKTGLVIPPNDAAALARAIHKLAANPILAAAMGRKALSLARGAWSWKQIARRHLEMYKSVLMRHEGHQ